MEDIVKFGPNMASFLLRTGSEIWYVVGLYRNPNDAPIVYCVEQALEEAPKGVGVIMLGDINAWLR